VAQAVRAGLRMQRAMQRFASLPTPLGAVSLQMRVGIHWGRHLSADIGTARRMWCWGRPCSAPSKPRPPGGPPGFA
jgi:class 3 adenylate cyclase